jgi:hypothetical protein
MVNRQKKALGWVDTLKAGSRALLGKELSRAANARAVSAVTPSYAKGGKVMKTGLARVHKVETVLTVAQTKSLKKALK